MKKEVQQFYNSVPDNYKEIVNELSASILNVNNQITQDIKWKKLTFGLNDDFHHWLCQINFTKKGVVLYFHFGGLLDDKYNVFITGESKFLRKIEFKSINDINKKIINDYISQAISKISYFKNNWKELAKQK
jgi:hypothetical protein